ncbi:MAG TPA: hypothetical protein VFR63_03400 [Gaiellaceae bacterium]|nr:hypothetical protein [Gaiellaceae bacterium]
MSSELNKKMVVIDDDPSVQEVVCGYLERDGYHVFVAGTADDGVDLAGRIKPGLIALDLMLRDSFVTDHVTHCVRGALASGDEETAAAKSEELLAAVERFAKTA